LLFLEKQNNDPFQEKNDPFCASALTYQQLLLLKVFSPNQNIDPAWQSWGYAMISIFSVF
jgi:hypothetical protein